MVTLIYQPLLIKTAFKSSDENQSEVFETFRSNRKTIALRLAKSSAGVDVNDVNNLDAEGYPIGFGKTSQASIITIVFSRIFR